MRPSISGEEGPRPPTRGGLRAVVWDSDRLACPPTRWQRGMRVCDCPGERRVRENRMHGVGGGGRKRVDDAQPYMDRWVARRWRASRLPHSERGKARLDRVR